MEDSFAKVGVISGNFFQDSKNNFRLGAQALILEGTALKCPPPILVPGL